MKLDLSALVVAIIAAIVTAILGGIGYCLNDYFQHPGKSIAEFYWRKVAALMMTEAPVYSLALVGLACFLAGAATRRLGRGGRATPGGNPPPPPLVATASRAATGFKIDAQHGGREVTEGPVTVGGTWQNKPTHPDRMVVLSRRGNTYWPQRKSKFVIHDDHTWTCRLHEMHRGDGRNDATIMIVRLSEQGSLWVEQYEKTIEELRKWVGLDISLLPDSIVIDDSVTIHIVPKPR